MNKKWNVLFAAAWLAWSGFGTFGLAHADSLYVTDKILLGMHQQPSEDSPIIKSVSSGTVLQVLQTQGAFTQVEASDGAVGWVSSSYLISHPPAQKLLTDLQAQEETNRKQVDALQYQLVVKNSEINDAKAKNAALKRELAAAKSTAPDSPQGKALAAAQAEVKSLQAKLASAQAKEQTQAKALDTPDQKALQQLHDRNMELQARIEQAIASLNGKKLPPPDELAAVRPKFPPWYLGLLAVMVLVGFILGVLFLDRRYRKRHGGFRV